MAAVSGAHQPYVPSITIPIVTTHPFFFSQSPQVIQLIEPGHYFNLFITQQTELKQVIP
jgi:hypothetical protein